nr:hypothetical protein [Tanacetum cinerariifolium]
MANKVKSSKLRRLRKVGASRRVESSDDIEDVFNQGRMIDDLDKDEGIELVKDDADIAESEGRHAAEQAENQYIKRYQGMKKRPQTESESRKNMMIYLKNIVGYKMDFNKGMTYAEICPIFQARFTLEQLVKVTRLQVEEESEMSLELLRFTSLRFTLEQLVK